MLLSESLGVSSAQLWKYGVFDSYLGIDAKLHVDPARLRTTRIPELTGAYKTFQNYFGSLLDMIEAAKPGDALERQAIRHLVFPEIKEAALGYAKASNIGRGVTYSLAEKLYATAKTIIDAGTKNPAIFELAVLFEDGFGPDLFSDMTVFMLLPQLGAFNRRVAEKLHLPVKKNILHGIETTLVYSKSQKLGTLLIPYSLLADLPLAEDWSEIDAVVGYNERLRQRVNVEVQKIWGKRVSNPAKYQIKQVLLDNKHLLRDLLAAYSKADARPYDIEKDPRGIVVWTRASREYAAKFPLPLLTPTTTSDVQKLVFEICRKFKHLVEEKGLSDLLFNENEAPKPERAAQLLFFGVADAYCVSNNLDISREPQTGRGPADFKLSRGHADRVIVELKLSSNAAALEGLTAQLPTYMKAEGVKSGVLLLIKVGAHDKRIKQVISARDKLVKDGKKVPDLFIVDATRKISGSKLKGFFDLEIDESG